MANQGEACSENRWLVVAMLNIFAAVLSSAQFREINSVSVVTSRTMDADIHFPVLMHFSSSRYPDLLTYRTDSSNFVLMLNDGKGNFTAQRTLGRSSSITGVTVGNVNNDGIDDVVIVHRDQNSVEVLFSSKADSAYVSQMFPVNFYPERAIIGDVTNDRIPDIITFGKLSSGVSVLQGRGNGKFHPFRIIFENIPVNDCALIALNGDQIPDIAIHNWLTNESTIHLGLGKLKFSEQTVLSFAQDTVKTLYADLTGDGITDVAVLSLQNSTVQILHGDGLGNFSFIHAVPLAALSYNISAASIAAPNSADLLIYENRMNTLSLLMNRGDGTFYDETVFGTGTSVSEILAGDLDGDGSTDIVFLEREQRRYTVLWNSKSETGLSEKKRSYAVGQRPTNLYVNDITSDGLDDIVVTNEGSSTVSILRSTGRSFAGQLSVETPEDPGAVSLYARSDSVLTIYTSHRKDPKISLFSLRREKDSLNSLFGELEQFSISLPERPVNVLPDVSYMQKGISLYAFMSTAPNAIVFYQQVKGTRFLAKSLVPLVPSKIAYSTINDLNNDGKTDLLYVYTGATVKNPFLGVTLNDSSGEFKGMVYSYPLLDSSLRKAFLFVDDFNGDQLKDCLLFVSPENSLRLALGHRETLFGSFEPVEDSISIGGPEQLQVYDVNNDGIMDIVYVQNDPSVLWYCRGKGNGRFHERTMLASIPSGSVFRCGDFNGDGAADVVFTEQNGMSVTVEYGQQK